MPPACAGRSPRAAYPGRTPRWAAPLAVMLLVLVAAPAAGQPLAPPVARDPAAELATAAYLETIRAEPLLLNVFLRAMPKGGDLHNHPSGAQFAERFVEYAAEEGLCVIRATLTLASPPCDAGSERPPATEAL